MSQNEIDIYDLVRELVGPIEPVGESHTDEKRLENLERLMCAIGDLLSDIHVIAHRRCHHQHSIKIAGKRAYEFLGEIGIPED